jgi:uncharacterized protein
LPIDWISLILVALVLVVAHSVETILGFGATVIALALGLFILPLNVLFPALVIVGILQSTWLVLIWRNNIRWRLLMVNILPFAVAGTIIGIIVRDSVNTTILLVLLYSFILVASAIEVIALYRAKGVSNPLPHHLAIPVLVGGGIFHGLIGAGGPMLVYYAGREIPKPEEFRATLSMLWLVLFAGMLIVMVISNQVSVLSLTLTVIVLPGFIAGVAIGSLIKLEALGFKTLTWSVLFIIGLVQLVRVLSGI